MKTGQAVLNGIRDKSKEQGSMSRQTRVFLFDVNGVLIDSNLANANAMAKAFSDDADTGRRIMEVYLGLSGVDRGGKIRRVQKEVMGRAFDEGEFDLLWDRFKALSGQSMLRVPLNPGSMEVLDELGSRGLTRVALSNTPQDELEKCLAVHGLLKRLDIVRGGGNWPKARSLDLLIREFKFIPAQCMFLGDGRGDLEAAASVKVPFTGIDAGTGEFDGMKCGGPYMNLAHWGREVLGLGI